jgi:two-component system, chemotaxis family, CheB/CheR fusion protein
MLLPTLAQDIIAVLEVGTPIEHRIDHEDRVGHFLLRIVPYRDASERTDGVVLTFIDVISIAVVEAHQRTLIAELNHRVKNMLTVAIGIAEQTFKSGASPAEFKAAFGERLRAMARSYELLSQENWAEAFIGQLIKLQLEPFGAERISMEGPTVKIKHSDALSIGMIFHELATNAAKHGALSVPEGRLRSYDQSSSQPVHGS